MTSRYILLFAVVLLIVMVIYSTYPRLPSEHWGFDQKSHVNIPPTLETVRAHRAIENWTTIPETIVIVGAVYKCGTYLDAVFENIRAITTLFQNYQILIAYDESPDDTLNKLEAWKLKLPQLTILKGRKSSKRRTDNLVLARNRYLQAMNTLYATQSFPYFIVMDFDDVCSEPIRLTVLQYMLAQSSKWEALSFPGKNSYYDIWALSCAPFWLSYLHFRNPNRALVCAKNFILREMIKGEWIPVHSAFGGFAIYKSDPFLKCTYANSFRQNLSFLTPAMIQAHEQAVVSRMLPTWAQTLRKWIADDDCEHRYFHFQATFGHRARMYIVPVALFAYVDAL